MITKISRIYRLPFFLTQDRLIIIMIILIIMINNSISVKISRLQNGRFFSQKLVLHGEKRERDNFARSAWSYVRVSITSDFSFDQSRAYKPRQKYALFCGKHNFLV